MNDMVNAERLQRAEYIGSSDAAAILGVSKWKTALDVWRAKVFPNANDDDADRGRAKILRRGTLLEPVIRAMAVEDYGLELYTYNRRHIDEDHDFLRAEIDFETLDPDSRVINNECKSVSPFAAKQWGEAGTDEVPIDYHAQVQFGLMITGAPRCDVWALFGSDDLVPYRIERDEETIAALRQRCIRFWHEHVVAAKAPPPVTLDDVEFLMRSRRGKPIVASPEHMELVAEYADLKARIKQMEERAAELKLDIVAALLAGADGALGEKDAASLIDPISGKSLLTWKPQSASRIDVATLREQRPDIAAEFTATTTTRVLRLAKT